MSVGLEPISRSLQHSRVCCCAREVLYALIRAVWPGYELIESSFKRGAAVWLKGNIPRGIDSYEGLLNRAWNGPRRSFRGMPENEVAIGELTVDEKNTGIGFGLRV